MSNRKARRAPGRKGMNGNRDPVVDRDSRTHVNRYGKPKVSFLSETTAKAAAQRRAEQHRSTTPDVYQCQVCKLWHYGGVAPA
jgi:hypothetical protein